MTAQPDTVIRTPRLVLRRARMDDLADLFRVFSNPQAMRYWDSPPQTDVEPVRRWLAGISHSREAFG